MCETAPNLCTTMDPTDSIVVVAASTSTSQTSPPIPITITTSLATSSAASVPSSDTPAASQSKRDEHFFARWICGEPGYDMKWLSRKENEDLRRAERAKLSREELEKLGFEEPY